MSKQETTVFTVFARNEWQDSHPEVGHTVEEICNWYEINGCMPLAWCVGSAGGDFGARVDALRAESIAAGRLIEKTASGWVALGAEKQEAGWLTSAKQRVEEKRQAELRKVDPTPAVQAEPAFLKELRDLVAIQGADGNWNMDDYSCGLYNGLELALATAEGRDPQYRTLKAPVVVQTPSTAKANPFPTTLRSPDCDSGPSDHLNASRHQMAGMSKS